MATLWLWLGFIAFLAAFITFDLRVGRRRARDASPGAAIGWTAAWIAISLAWGGLIYVLYDRHWGGLGSDFVDLAGRPGILDGRHAFLRFITAYTLEAALNLDNLFVIALIFAYFRLPRSTRHAVLFYGALPMIAVRGLWIAIGASLLALAPWMTYVFGGILLLAAVKMLTLPTDDPNPDSNPAIRLVRRLYPISAAPSGRRFFTRIPDEAFPARPGRLAMTPLLAALLMVESADAVYALGSIPASLAIARDPLLAFSSNVLAVLTVRSMYHALAPVLNRFTYVKASLVFVLLYVAILMLLGRHYVIAPEVSISVIVGLLCIGAAASLISDPGRSPPEPPLGHDVERYARLTVAQARKLIILVIGLSTLAISVPIGILLPGPGGIPIAILGLMILATEFVWARQLLKHARRGADLAAAEAERRLGLITTFRNLRHWAARRLGRSP